VVRRARLLSNYGHFKERATNSAVRARSRPAGCYSIPGSSCCAASRDGKRDAQKVVNINHCGEATNLEQCSGSVPAQMGD
jgi:hypothetical protein